MERFNFDFILGQIIRADTSFDKVLVLDSDQKTYWSSLQNTTL